MFKPFLPNTSFLNTLKTSENLKGVENECIGSEWVNTFKVSNSNTKVHAQFAQSFCSNSKVLCPECSKLTGKRVKPRHLTGCGVFVITASFPNMNIWVFIEFRLNICLIIWSCSKGSGLSIHMPRVQNH